MSSSYDPRKLTWNDTHTVNKEHQYCYCGGDRNLIEVSLQCSDCLNWFHVKCIKISVDTTIPIFTNYIFHCKLCNPSGEESFKRCQAGWKEIGGCAIANLMLHQHMTDHNASKGDSRYLSANSVNLSPFRYYFNKNEHLRPFVDKNWSSLCTERSRTATCMTPPAMQSNSSNAVIALIQASSSNTEFGQSGEQNNLRHGFKYLPCELDNLFPYVQYRNSELSPYGVRLSKEDASLSVWISGDQLTTTTEFGFSMARANCSVKEGQWFYEVFIDRGGEGKIDGKDAAHVRVGWARRNRNSPVGSDAYSYGFRDLTGHKIHQSRLYPYGEPFKTGDVIGLYISLPPLKKVIPGYQPISPKRHRIPILFKGDTMFEYKDFKPTHKMNQLLELPEKKNEKKYWWQQKQDESKPSSTSQLPELATLPGSKIIVYKNGICQDVAFENLFSFFPTVDEYTNDDDLTEDDGSLGYYPAVSMFRGGTCTLNFAEDILNDIVDEIEIWDWMVSQKQSPIKRPAVVDLSDGGIMKKRKLDESYDETSGDN
ncbi:16763_t:CDS:2, partial [Gigaspora margarita]